MYDKQNLSPLRPRLLNENRVLLNAILYWYERKEFKCTFEEKKLESIMRHVTKGILILFLLLYSTSCLKDKAEEIAENAATIKDAQVPDNFTFSTTKTVTARVKIDNPEVLTSYRYVVRIYDAAPAEGGNLLNAGVVNSEDYTYSPTITVPSNMIQVWVVIYLGNEIVQQGNLSLN
ncbi:MAG: hypothetical protein AAGU19_15490 [Prolixibacteraceae bacterium]